MAVTSSPHALPSQHIWDPKQRVHIEAVSRTPWLGQGIQPVSGPLTPCTEGKTGLRSTNPMYRRRPLTPGAKPGGSVFRAVKPRIGN